MRGAWWVVMIGALACEEPVTQDIVTEPLTRASEPPEVGIDLEDGGEWITPGVLSGFALDADQAPSTLPIRIESAVDGMLYQGNPEPDGTWRWQGALSPGPNPLQVTATDREGNQTSVALLAEVRTNRQPDCRIVSPLGGQQVRVRTDVPFAAEAIDPDGDPVSVLWRSDLDGGLGIGLSFTRRLRVVGEHRISLEVSDGFGSPCTDSIRLVVVD